MNFRRAAVLSLVVLTGCAGPQSSLPSESEPPSLVPTSPLASSPPPSPSPTRRPTPVATPEATPTPIVVEGCVESDLHYALYYPATWYSNVGVQDWPDCGLFATVPFTTSDDPAVKIRLLAQPRIGGSDPFQPLGQEFEGMTILADEETTIGGRRAWMREFVFPADNAALQVHAGDRQLTYDVDLAKIFDGWILHAEAMGGPDDYPETVEVLNQMLLTLGSAVIGP